MYKIKNYLNHTFLYLFLGAYTISVIYPILLMVLTAFKSNKEIFSSPFSLPKNFDFNNFIVLFRKANYIVYFKNSIIVAIFSILLILSISSLASYAIAKYKFKLSNFLYMYFLAGIMIPVKLGTVNILQIMVKLHLIDNIASLIVVYTAMGIPIGIFILTSFIKEIPEELSNAARIDGCSEPRIFFNIIIPLIRPALSAVAIYNFVPIWNEFWFPLILLKSRSAWTVPLATAQLFGQFETQYGLVFALLTMASLPVIAFYLLLSKQFVKGLSAGALKG